MGLDKMLNYGLFIFYNKLLNLILTARKCGKWLVKNLIGIL